MTIRIHQKILIQAHLSPKIKTKRVMASASKTKMKALALNQMKMPKWNLIPFPENYRASNDRI